MILYITNLMPKSRTVFRHALGIAQRFKAKIYIVHVVPQLDPSQQKYLAAWIGEEKYQELAENLDSELSKTVQDRLDKFTDEELQEHPEYIDSVAGVEILYGHPTDNILNLADKLDADLLVFGSHKEAGGLSGLLGSAVKRVLRRSRRPVMVVPVGD
jgi:nucleotide-binding universal stress UspA family protein